MKKSVQWNKSHSLSKAIYINEQVCSSGVEQVHIIQLKYHFTTIFLS